MKYALVLLLGLVFSKNRIIAQVKEDSLMSKIFNESRHIKIALPEDYFSESDKRYDLVYLIDGEWTTDMVPQIQQLAVI